MSTSEVDKQSTTALYARCDAALKDLNIVGKVLAVLDNAYLYVGSRRGIQCSILGPQGQFIDVFVPDGGPPQLLPPEPDRS